MTSLTRQYIAEVVLDDKHKFKTKVIHKNVLDRFMVFIKDDIPEDGLTLDCLKKYKDEVLLPELNRHKDNARKMGIPFRVYRDLLFDQVMNEQTIAWYENDIRLFIEWCQSKEIKSDF